MIKINWCNKKEKYLSIQKILFTKDFLNITAAFY